MIPQEGIYEQVREVRDKIAEEANPHGVDATLTIRALEAGTTTIVAFMSDAAGKGVGELTDPQYAVVKQVRIPVAVVITSETERVGFSRFDRVYCGTLTRKELSRSRPHSWIGITEFGLFIVGCGEECKRGSWPRPVCILWPESPAHEMGDHLDLGSGCRGGSRQDEGYHTQKPTQNRVVRTVTTAKCVKL